MGAAASTQSPVKGMTASAPLWGEEADADTALRRHMTQTIELLERAKREGGAVHSRRSNDDIRGQ